MPRTEKVTVHRLGTVEVASCRFLLVCEIAAPQTTRQDAASTWAVMKRIGRSPRAAADDLACSGEIALAALPARLIVALESHPKGTPGQRVDRAGRTVWQFLLGIHLKLSHAGPVRQCCRQGTTSRTASSAASASGSEMSLCGGARGARPTLQIVPVSAP